MTENYIYQYYQKINDGSIVAGKWIHMLYKRIVDGIESGEYHLDLKKANKAVMFIEQFCHHPKGKWAPKSIAEAGGLQLWQRAMISCIYGIVDENGVRVWREVFTVIGRKNGKSLLASGITEEEVFARGVYGADAYFVAPKLEQADIVFSDFRNSVNAEPELAALVKSRKSDLYISETNTSIKKIACKASTADGFNPQVSICDEVAAWKGDQGIKMYEVMTSALAAREDPLIVAITTANYINNGIYDELFKRSTAFLMGHSNEKRILPFLYTIDDLSKWNDLTELQKSLPNLGVSVGVNYILEEIAKAETSFSNKAEFLCKQCCIKQNSSQAWLTAETVEKCCGEALRLEDFRSTYCVGGIDLSQTTDLTSCCAVIERGGELYVFSRFFLPAEKLQEATERDGIPYQAYVQRGILQLSGENFVDYDDCFRWFKSLVEEYEIYPLQTGYDKWMAQNLVKDMEDYGFHMDDVYQGFNLTPVLREMEGLMKDGRVHIGDNDLLKIHLLDAALKMDTETNKVKLIKMSATAHIDGTAALSDALCVRQKWYNEIGVQLRNE